jgi:CBS domain-containing protein
MKKDVHCLTETGNAQDAAKRMDELNVGFLPVCDRDQRRLGTLTDRDLALRVCAQDRRASQVGAAEVMSKEVIACRPDDDLGAAERLMAQHHKSRILVTDNDGRLVGVISLSDIVAREEPQAAIRTMREIVSREAQVM